MAAAVQSLVDHQAFEGILRPEFVKKLISKPTKELGIRPAIESIVKEKMGELHNVDGCYAPVSLSPSLVAQLDPIVCRIEKKSGHLVAETQGLAQKLFNICRQEIEDCLTEAGKTRLSILDNPGDIVIIYMNELKAHMEDLVGERISISFKQLCVVVPSDDRYALIASVLVDSSSITTIRKNVGLLECHSEKYPSSYTFAAVGKRSGH